MRYFVNRRTTVLTVIALVLLVVGAMYLFLTASQLPPFFPGHVARAHDAPYRTVPGVVIVVIAAVVLGFARHESEKAMGDYY